MNERIRQLADQAHEYASGVYDQRIATEGPENVFFYQISNDKFAELIVQECIDIISPYTVRMSRPGEEYLHPIQEIKEHFGVEL